jgi:cytochrome c oxidase cbb3-type subunit 3
MNSSRIPRLVVISFLCFAGRSSLFGQAPQANVANEGAQLYSSNCSLCHGADGKGGGRGPAIATMRNVIAMSDADIAGVVHNGNASQGMPAFPDLGDAGTRAVVRYLRTLQGVSTAPLPVKVTGNTDAGRALFFGKAQCSSCHMVKGQGGFLGTDMTTYAQGHTRDEIVQAIVKPDTQLLPTARVVQVKTKAGLTLVGVVRSEDSMNLTLQTEDGRFHFLTRSGLSAINYTDHSLMPHDYGTRLTPGELDDIADFLIVTGQDAPAEAAPPTRRHVNQ